MIREANRLAGIHGIGRLDMIENGSLASNPARFTKPQVCCC